MHRRNDIERILDRHRHFIAVAQADDRSEDGCRVAISPRRLARNECMQTGCDFQFDGIALTGRIDQFRDRQRRAERCRFAQSGAAANDGTRHDARRADCKSTPR